jgi:hypothetical protein
MLIIKRGAVHGTQFISTSSVTLKENIQPIDLADATSWVDALHPVTYNRKVQPGRRLMGFVVEGVPAPFAVDAKGVDVMAVVETLTAVVQTQREALARLQARVDALESGGANP